MLSTPRTPADNRTGRSQAVLLCNENSICPFILGHRTSHIGCLATWRWKVLLWRSGKVERMRASNQQSKRPPSTELMLWFWLRAERMLPVTPLSTQQTGLPIPAQVAAFTAITSGAAAIQGGAVGELVRRCQCVEATQPQSPSSFCNRALRDA